MQGILLNKSKLAVQQSEQFLVQPVANSTHIPLEPVMDLISELNHQEIRYCHWKSNSRLDWSLAGQTDLDLLIDPEQESQFKDILKKLGIKAIISPPSAQYPGLEHYLGFDNTTGRLFHLHVHYHLVLGEQYVKNYRLPIEEQFLDCTRIVHDVKIPVPELELIVLSIRALLKYRDRDMVKDVFNIRFPGIPEHILNEILWLLDQTSLEDVSQMMSSLAVFSDEQIILDFLQVVTQAPRSGWQLFQLRGRLRRELRKNQRKNRLSASMHYFRSLLKKTKLFRSSDDQRLRLPGKGKLIALIGIDGSGKSTLSTEISEWLKWKVSAPLHYLGSKQPSVWSDWSYIIFRIFRRSISILTQRVDEDNFFIRILKRFRQFFLGLHYLSVGVDRYKRFRWAKKQKESGSVVIFDRFPFFSPLDGPEIHLISDGNLYFLTKKLAKIEQRLYRRFDTLDLILILDVNPQVSVERKPDHSIETIQAKYSALLRLKTELKEESDRWKWLSVDSNNPIEQVLLDLKTAVWSEL